jgi:hypothetical protein
VTIVGGHRLQQVVQDLADWLQLGLVSTVALDAMHVVASTFADIGCQQFIIVHSVGFTQQAVQTLDGLNRQLQATHHHDVRDDLGGVHPLLSSPHRQRCDLLIGDACKGCCQQVGAMFNVVAAEPAPEVVQRAQLKLTPAEALVTDSIAHLQIIRKLIVSSSSLQP